MQLTKGQCIAVKVFFFFCEVWRRGLQGYYVVEVASVAVLTGNVEAVEHLGEGGHRDGAEQPHTSTALPVPTGGCFPAVVCSVSPTAQCSGYTRAVSVQG